MIRLQFIAENDPGSRLIQWFSAGEFSHVDAVLPDGMLLGARSNVVKGIKAGVQVRPQEYLEFSKQAILAVPATETQERAFYNFLYMEIGKPYDHTAILAFLFNRGWRDTDSWYCSELVAAAGEAGFLFPRLVVPVNKITPVACSLLYSTIRGSTFEWIKR
jgi:hypothetical protein